MHDHPRRDLLLAIYNHVNLLYLCIIAGKDALLAIHLARPPVFCTLGALDDLDTISGRERQVSCGLLVSAILLTADPFNAPENTSSESHVESKTARDIPELHNHTTRYNTPWPVQSSAWALVAAVEVEPFS
jgi:hypothetical protein